LNQTFALSSTALVRTSVEKPHLENLKNRSFGYLAERYGGSPSGLANVGSFHEREHFQRLFPIDRRHASPEELGNLNQ
jgi:hypothetical protein